MKYTTDWFVFHPSAVFQERDNHTSLEMYLFWLFKNQSVFLFSGGLKGKVDILTARMEALVEGSSSSTAY